MQVIPKRKIWYSFSGVVILAAVLALMLWGVKPGIDFTGGSLLEVSFPNTPPAIEELQSTFAEIGLGEPLIQPTGETSVVFKFAPVTEAEHQNVVDVLREKYGDLHETRFDSIGPAVGKELFQKSVVAIIIVTLVVLLYIAWSFRKVSRPVPAWVYGVVVVLAFVHDTIIPLGVFAWLGKFREIEVGTPFIAAVLMILGYSINDTIVVLDRIRENIKRLKGTFEEIVEASIHQTIARSVNTSLTTLLVLIALFIFGGSTLQIFSLALIIGIILGTYSSIFIAAPLVVSWYRWKRRR